MNISKCECCKDFNIEGCKWGWDEAKIHFAEIYFFTDEFRNEIKLPGFLEWGAGDAMNHARAERKTIQINGDLYTSLNLRSVHDIKVARLVTIFRVEIERKIHDYEKRLKDMTDEEINKEWEMVCNQMKSMRLSS